ncbi:FeoB-associated Cys-rich membrane protein [uncultured Porphyromonas sp.]|nr:FeoB-associated Cys-rich membrane protein [uncultured Porphyromonas sp.]
MIQDIAVALILIIVVFFIGRSLWQMLRSKKGDNHPGSGCSGCTGCSH